MKITINGSATLAGADLGTITAHAAAAAADGFGTYWLAQTGLVDALMAFTAMAPTVEGVEFGTAVVPTYPRHPSALASQALTAQAATGGRIALGIGLSHKPAVEDRWGMSFDRPIRHMLDYLSILESLLATGKADFRGEMFTCIAESARPTDEPPSLLIAALGPQLLRIAGARTDGTILWMVGEHTVADHIAPIINEAASSADRSTPRIVCSLPVCVTDDAASMRDLASKTFAIYGQLPSYRAMLDREGADDPADVALIGSAAEVTDRLHSIAAAGATEFSALEFTRNDDEAEATRAVLAEFNAA